MTVFLKSTRTEAAQKIATDRRERGSKGAGNYSLMMIEAEELVRALEVLGIVQFSNDKPIPIKGSSNSRIAVLFADGSMNVMSDKDRQEAIEEALDEIEAANRNQNDPAKLAKLVDVDLPDGSIRESVR